MASTSKGFLIVGTRSTPPRRQFNFTVPSALRHAGKPSASHRLQRGRESSSTPVLSRLAQPASGRATPAAAWDGRSGRPSRDVRPRRVHGFGQLDRAVGRHERCASGGGQSCRERTAMIESRAWRSRLAQAKPDRPEATSLSRACSSGAVRQGTPSPAP